MRKREGEREEVRGREREKSMQVCSKCWMAVAIITIVHSCILSLPEGTNGSLPGWQHGGQDEIGVGEQLLSSRQITVTEI